MARTPRDNYLRRTYGISEAEYEEILERQVGTCWICDKPPKKRRLHVDHKHVKRDKKQPPEETRKRVRGLLCWNCNGGIAKFNDNSSDLKAAGEYLDAWPAQYVLKGDLDD